MHPHFITPAALVFKARGWASLGRTGLRASPARRRFLERKKTPRETADGHLNRQQRHRHGVGPSTGDSAPRRGVAGGAMPSQGRDRKAAKVRLKVWCRVLKTGYFLPDD